MALTRITKGVIKPNENYDTHNINSTGIVTAIGLDVNGNGDISGNLSVGGVLTYEDVTSIDSVGVITARSDLNVDGHTNLDNVSVAGVTTFSDDVTFATASGNNIVFDKSDNQLEFGNDVKAEFGASGQLEVNFESNSGNSVIKHTANAGYLVLHSDNLDLRPRSNGGHVYLRANYNDGVDLYFANSKKFETTAQGIEVTGHSELDNVSVAGVGTFTGNVGIAESIFHVGDTNTTIGFPANDHIKIHTGGVERLLINNSYNWLKNQTFVNTTILSDTSTFLVRNNTQSYHTIWESQNTNSRSTIFQWNDYGNSGTAGNLIFRSRNSPYEEHARFTGAGNFNLLKDLDVDGHTNLDNVSIAGVITATTYYGNGSNLTGIDATALKDPAGNVKIQAQASGAVHTGIATFQDLDVDGHTNLDNVSVAGVSTFTGQARFNGEVVAGGVISVNTGGSINIPDKLIHSGDTDTAIRFPSDNTFSIETAGVERLRIRSDGHVGVGTNNPQADFEVFGYSSAASGAAPILAIRNGYSGTANQSNALKSELRFLHKNHNAAHEFMAARIIADTTNNYSQLTTLRFLVANGNNGTERLTIDPAGRVYIGYNTNIAVGGSNPHVQVTGTTDGTAHLSIRNFSANTTGAILSLAKSRGSVGAYTAVQDDDVLGQINFAGADGTDLAEVSGKIVVACDAAVASNRIPSRMEFYNTDGNGTLDLNMVLTRDSQLFLTSGVTRDAMFALAHSSANDFVFGRTTGGADTGMTIVTPSATSGFINFADADGQRQGSILYQHGSGSDKMFFRTNNNQTGLVIDSAQKVLIGDPSANIYASYGGKLQVSNTNFAMNSFANNSHAQTLLFAKSRATSGSGGTIVQDNDFCGHVEWYADDGVDTANQIAKISGRINGTPGANDTPGELIFYTTADGANTSTERLRIEADGRLVLSNSGGIQLSPVASNLYSVNGALSYYATNNGVYLNGAGDTGLLRLNATGTYNDRTSINLFGKDVANYQDTIQFRTVSEERLRIKNTGETLAKTLAGNYYPVASARDGSTSARAATSAWEIKKTLGPAATTGFYYLKDPYDGTVAQWWCDMSTDGGGWILIASCGDGQMSALSTADGNHWYNRSHRGGFDGITSGYYKGGGYWRKTNGGWGDNTCGQLMWDCRINGSDIFGNDRSNHKVVFNWGTDQPLPTGGSGYGNIPNAPSRKFANWCYDVLNAPHFDPGNFHQNQRGNTINGNTYFTEHMVITWSFRGTGGAGDDGSSGPYWQIGAHHDGLHQHYEESIQGGDGVYGDGGYLYAGNEDTGWGGGGQNGGVDRRSSHNQSGGTVKIWLR